MAGKARLAPGKAERGIDLEVSATELDDLVELARYYERSMGFMRHLIRWTASSEVRRKLRFVVEEGNALAAFSESECERLGPDESVVVRFTPRAFIAYWGRTLASLNTKRSRRKLKGERLERREQLARRFTAAAKVLREQDAPALETEMSTRRPKEIEWMREALESVEG
ncbi:MAG: hypothetical protein ACRDFS_13270 [Chloroflexota bacterium]